MFNKLKNKIQGVASRLFGAPSAQPKAKESKQRKKLDIFSRNLSGSERRRLMRDREKIIKVGARSPFSREDKVERKMREATMRQLIKWHRRLARACKQFSKQAEWKKCDPDRKPMLNSAAARAGRYGDLAAVEIFSRQYKPETL